MTSRDFCYWLQGFFEIDAASRENPEAPLCVEQVDMIKKHLALVFKHEIDPSYGDAKHQAELNEIHNKIEKLENKKPVHVPPPVYRC
jgi:hypothetical protein